MEWLIVPYRRFAEFSGRSRRREYWMFLLFQILVYAIFIIMLLMVAAATGAFSGGEQAGAALVAAPLFWLVLGLTVLFWLVTFIPNLAVKVRRFHDQSHSGWMVLLGFIPYVGWLVVLIFMCLAGTRGPNRFGPDPVGESDHEVFA